MFRLCCRMAYKIPESVLVVVYTRQLEVLLLQRADGGSWGNWGAWQSVTGSREPDDPDLEATARRESLPWRSGWRPSPKS